MNPDTLLSSFTPSAMSHEALEAIFVQREPLAQQLMARLRESAFTSAKSHTLLVGPRGIGKTHLVSLIYHRVRAQAELDERVRIAWLREETWEVTSFLELLESILAALAEEYKDTHLKNHLPELIRMPPAEAEAEAEQRLLEFLGDHTLLVIAENLDELFEGLGKDGQHKLRAFLENRGNTVLLATTTGLFGGVSDYESPFYNFFNVTHLRELTRSEVTEMLLKVAELRKDQELIDYLGTPIADRRLEVVEAMAGGHPRIWILFAACLSRDLLDELVPLFMKMLDDLTPYYQDRMRYLPAQQRKIVVYLCKRQGAIPVKKVAEECRLPSPQGAASQLHQLEEKGYVRTIKESEGMGRRSTGDRRASYYELREPLMRLCFDVKESRGKPIRLIVDFLRLWYESTELRKWLEVLPNNASIARRYVSAALSLSSEAVTTNFQSDTTEPSPEKYLFNEVEQLENNEDFEGALRILMDIIHSGKSRSKVTYGLLWEKCGYYLDELERNEEALDAYNIALEANEESVNLQKNKARVLYNLGRMEESLEVCSHVVQDDPGDFITHYNRGLILYNLGRLQEALDAYSESISARHPESWYPQFGRALIFAQLNQWDEFFEVLNDALFRASFADEIEQGDHEFYCRSLLLNIQNIHYWSERIGKLIVLYEDCKALGALGQGLTDSISTLFDETVTDFVAQRWNDAWQEVGAYSDELIIPLRLLDAAVKWRETRDRRHLLALAVEERRILEQLLPKD